MPTKKTKPSSFYIVVRIYDGLRLRDSIGLRLRRALTSREAAAVWAVERVLNALPLWLGCKVVLDTALAFEPRKGKSLHGFRRYHESNPPTRTV
jgi:hypothetical protein